MDGWRQFGRLPFDTYNFPKGFGEEQVILEMVGRFKQFMLP
jgi:hypothetical protein